MKLPYLGALASLGTAASGPLAACSASPDIAPETSPKEGSGPGSVTDPTPQVPLAPEPKEPTMSAATSPTGEPHPGEILHDDKVDGRTWTVKASEVPPTIGWVQTGAGWQAVVRIEISGTREQRRFTKFGLDGAMLESTIQSRPPPRTPEPEPVPMPTPIPTPTEPD